MSSEAKHTPGPLDRNATIRGEVIELRFDSHAEAFAELHVLRAQLANRLELLEVLEAMASYFGGAKDRLGRPDQSANDEMRAARATVQALALRFGVASGHHTVTDQCAAVMRAAIAKATGA